MTSIRSVHRSLGLSSVEGDLEKIWIGILTTTTGPNRKYATTFVLSATLTLIVCGLPRGDQPFALHSSHLAPLVLQRCPSPSSTSQLSALPFHSNTRATHQNENGSTTDPTHASRGSFIGGPEKRSYECSRRSISIGVWSRRLHPTFHPPPKEISRMLEA